MSAEQLLGASMENASYPRRDLIEHLSRQNLFWLVFL